MTTNETPLQTAVRLLDEIENDVTFMREPGGYLLTFAQMDKIVRFNRTHPLDAGAPDDVRDLVDALKVQLRQQNNLVVLGEWSAEDRNHKTSAKLQAEIDAANANAQQLIDRYRPHAPATEADPFEGGVAHG